MHVYQMRSPNPEVVSDTQKRMKRCMFALKEISKVWVVAKMVYTLFESIIGNKALEERLQKAAERRHHRKGAQQVTGIIQQSQQPDKLTEPVKRKFDEMDIGGVSTGPVQNLSYERSRPQTPAPSLPVHPQSIIPHNRSNSVDAAMGLQSKGNTRPPTPFQGFSVPSTPAPLDIYLVTRSSPPISQSLLENFQPNQLFPEDSGMDHYSPQVDGITDPQIVGVPGLTQQAINQHMLAQGKIYVSLFDGSSNKFDANQSPDIGINSYTQQPPQQHVWPGDMHLDPNAPPSGSSPDDSWSNSSLGGAVPTMLNVEDW